MKTPQNSLLKWDSQQDFLRRKICKGEKGIVLPKSLCELPSRICNVKMVARGVIRYPKCPRVVCWGWVVDENTLAMEELTSKEKGNRKTT